jgi:hypothetical protein
MILLSDIISSMDRHRTAYSLKAPSRTGSGSALHLPGREPFPAVNDHLVVPETTRDEVVNGRRVVAQPAEAPHADQHGELQYVLRAHAAPGYQASVDLLTRHGETSDFASDCCVYKKGTDPATGTRYLEEIAFEVVSEQNERIVTEKAEQMHRRGVRRIFAVFVKGPQRVCEWVPESRGWRALERGSWIEDPHLVKPLAVAALLEAAAADNAVVEALAAKGNPALQKREADAEAKGEAKGRTEGRTDGLREALLFQLATKFGALDAETEERVRAADPDHLLRWMSQILDSHRLHDVFAS